MKVNHHSMLSNGSHGWVFILTLAKREFRLYAYWRDRNPYIKLPVEIQIRQVPNDPNTVKHIPKRRTR